MGNNNFLNALKPTKGVGFSPVKVKVRGNIQPKNNFVTVINIDSERNMVRFGYREGENDTQTHYDNFPIKTKLFDEEFFARFSDMLEKYSSKHPAAQNAETVVILPNECITIDTFDMPTMNKMKMASSLDIIIADTYRNSRSLRINKFMIAQNRQYTTFGAVMVNEKLLVNIYAACAKHKMTPRAVTYGASSGVTAAAYIKQKWKGESYILANIMENKTVYSLVAGGRCAGFFTLPFGYSIMEKSRLAAEDMLFDTQNADLVVLNATEKAKAKQLTMMKNDISMTVAEGMAEEAMEEEQEQEQKPMESIDGTDNEDEYESSLTQGTAEIQTTKTLPPKTPRKLPKFLTREVHGSSQEYACENFRLFMKWALNLAQENKNLFGEPIKRCFVNMPRDFQFVYDAVNKEFEESGMEFFAVSNQEKNHTMALNDLETNGGFYTNPANRDNIF